MLGAFEQIEQSFHKLLAFLVRHFRDKARQRLVKKRAGLVGVGHSDKLVARYIPGVEVVLPEVVLNALHDHALVLVTEHLADDRGLRHVGDDAFPDLLKGAVRQILRLNAGTVHVVNRPNALSQRFAAEGCGVDRHGTALGMTAEHPFAAERRVCRFKIPQRLCLRRHRELIKQVEILLPADQRLIRSAVGEKVQPFLQFDDDRAELHGRCFIDAVDKAAQLQILKSFAGAEDPEQPIVALPDIIGGLFGGKRPFGRFQKRDLLRQVCADDHIQRQIGKPCENRRVQLAEGDLVQRQITAPCEIIKQICHACSLPDIRRCRRVRVLFFQRPPSFCPWCSRRTEPSAAWRRSR